MQYLYDSLDTFPDHPELGRTLVSYDRYGLTIQSWRENEDEETTEPFEYRERWLAWPDVRKQACQYSGQLKDRLVQALQDLLCEYAHYSGPVPDTQTVINEYGNQRHW